MTHISRLALSLLVATSLALPAAAQDRDDDNEDDVVSGLDVGVSLDGDVPAAGPAQLRLHFDPGLASGLQKGDALDQLELAVIARPQKGPYQLVVISIIGVLIGMREVGEDGGEDVVVTGDVVATAPLVGFVDASGKGDYAFDVAAGSDVIDEFDADGRAASITIAVAKGKKKKGERTDYLIATMSDVVISSWQTSREAPDLVVLTADSVASARTGADLVVHVDVKGAAVVEKGGSTTGNVNVTVGAFDDVADDDAAEKGRPTPGTIHVTVGAVEGAAPSGGCEIHVVLGVNAWPVMVVYRGSGC